MNSSQVSRRAQFYTPKFISPTNCAFLDALIAGGLGMNRTIKTILNIVSVAAVIGSSVYIGKFYLDNKESENHETEVKNLITVRPELDADGDSFHFTKDQFKQLKEKYSDFVGWMAFDDEYASLPLVQSYDNDYYLRRWIDGSYDVQGTVFFDYLNKINGDTNLTIYGHRVSYDESTKFSPLSKLVNQEEYDKHYEFKIWYENEVRTYVITNIFYYNSYTDMDFDFTQRNFYTRKDFEKYHEYVNRYNLIQSNEELKYGDRFLSLQTCKINSGIEKIICIAKQVQANDYE